MNDLIYDGPADLNIETSSPEEEKFLRCLKSKKKCVLCQEINSILFMLVLCKDDGNKDHKDNYICLDCAEESHILEDWNRPSRMPKDKKSKCAVCIKFKQNWCFLKFKDGSFRKCDTCIGCRNIIKLKQLIEKSKAKISANSNNDNPETEMLLILSNMCEDHDDHSLLYQDRSEYNRQKDIKLICNGCNQRISKIKIVGSILFEPNDYYICLNCASKAYAENRIKGNIQPSFNKITQMVSRKNMNGSICSRCNNKYPSWTFIDECSFSPSIYCIECRKKDEIIFLAFKNCWMLQFISPLFNDEERIINSKDFSPFKMNQSQQLQDNMLYNKPLLIPSLYPNPVIPYTVFLPIPQMPLPSSTFPNNIQQQQIPPPQGSLQLPPASQPPPPSSATTTTTSNTTTNNNNNNKEKIKEKENKSEEGNDNNEENIVKDENGNEKCILFIKRCKDDLNQLVLFGREGIECYCCNRTILKGDSLYYPDGKNYCLECSAKYKRFSNNCHLITPTANGKMCKKCQFKFPKWYFLDDNNLIYTELCLDCKNKNKIAADVKKGRIKHRYKASDLLFTHYSKDKKQYETVKEEKIKCSNCDQEVPKLFTFSLLPSKTYRQCMCETCAITERVNLLSNGKESSFSIKKRINQVKVGRKCNLCMKTYEEWCYIDENIEEYTKVCILCRVRSMLILKTDKVLQKMSNNGMKSINQEKPDIIQINTSETKVVKDERIDKEKEKEEKEKEDKKEMKVKEEVEEIKIKNDEIEKEKDKCSKNNNELSSAPPPQQQQPSQDRHQQQQTISLASNFQHLPFPFQQIPFPPSPIPPSSTTTTTTTQPPLYSVNTMYSNYQKYLLHAQQQEYNEPPPPLPSSLQQQQQQQQNQLSPFINQHNQNHSYCPSLEFTMNVIPSSLEKNKNLSITKYDYSQITQLNYYPQKRKLSSMITNEQYLYPKYRRLSSSTLFSISANSNWISRQQLEKDFAEYTRQKNTFKSCIDCNAKISNLETFGSPTNKKPMVENNEVYLCMICASKKYKRGIRFNRIIDKDPNGKFCKKCKGFYPTWVFINESGSDYYKNCIECRIREKLSKISDSSLPKNGVPLVTHF